MRQNLDALKKKALIEKTDDEGPGKNKAAAYPGNHGTA